ncbi:sulfite exporter TauE/SafE family protein [Salipiger abyssi]|uniref:sulfite exporter TauE/SafE family protein n=1 Tax=Salipiger abyssi TaxID=1250539 RepID=UPI004059643F
MTPVAMSPAALTQAPLFYGVMALAVIILGLSKGGFAGIGMASTPLIAAFTDPLTAAGLMLPILLVQDQLVVFLYRRRVNWRVIRRMLPGGLAGVAAAYVLATAVPDWTVKAVLGVVSVLFALWQFTANWRRVPARRGDLPCDRLLGFLAGTASGFTSAIAHAGPPPFQIYVMPKRLPTEVYVGTSVVFFAAVNLLKLPSFIALGLFSAQTLKISVLYLPLALASSWVGAWLVRRIDAERFRTVITTILLGVGCVLIWQARVGAGAPG